MRAYNGRGLNGSSGYDDQIRRQPAAWWLFPAGPQIQPGCVF